MKKFLVMLAIVLSCFTLTACTDADEATRVLKSQGYTQIDITGYSFFGCSEDDWFRTGFDAYGQNGQYVSGVVCSGVFKGATVRLD